ncbi:MAG: hypothetical protein IKQ54_08420 [Oscillospiraceae bacterium]|nr:hypothetical protein [Oscillospiraceae bacterium]
MKKLWNRIPLGWKLAMTLLTILLLLLAAWAMEDYPSLSAGMAFRRGLRDAGLPAAKMELFLETNWFPMALGSDEENTYLSTLAYHGHHTWTCYDAWSIPREQGIWYADLRWDQRGGNNFPYDFDGPNDGPVAAFAVKADGAARAELSLVLEDCVTTVEPMEGEEAPEPEQWYGGSYPLVLRELRDGWFIFDFDSEYFKANLREGNNSRWFDEPAYSLVRWIDRYYGESWHICPAHLILRTYDESGSLLRTVRWDP